MILRKLLQKSKESLNIENEPFENSLVPPWIKRKKKLLYLIKKVWDQKCFPTPKKKRYITYQCIMETQKKPSRPSLIQKNLNWIHHDESIKDHYITRLS